MDAVNFRVESDAEAADLKDAEADRAPVASDPSVAAAGRVDAMAARCGLLNDELDSFPGLKDAVVRVCEHCGEAGTCARAMAGEEPFPISVCPNAALYATLRSE